MVFAIDEAVARLDLRAFVGPTVYLLKVKSFLAGTALIGLTDIAGPEITGDLVIVTLVDRINLWSWQGARLIGRSDH
ncbi:MAG: hypothetical protein M2R45_03368 [Verrucomicrobia subdivision 3 bacterium]|nr:hypothetical protein [Limisphaerales bacterium]MCS1416719.1 hypothetical protein [Limisphaerales bacterium]